MQRAGKLALETHGFGVTATIARATVFSEGQNIIGFTNGTFYIV